MTNAPHVLLIPIDGSKPAERAVQYAIDLIKAGHQSQVHLLNIQTPISGDVSAFVGSNEVNSYHREEAEKCLAPAKQLLDAAGIPYTSHIGLGHPGHTVAAFAKDLGCTQIIMGTRGLGSAMGRLLGSVASDVIRETDRPVTLIK